MKRILAPLLIFALLFAPSCSKAAKQPPPPDDLAVNEAYHAALTAYIWFDADSMPCDTSVSQEVDGKRFSLVTYPSIQTLAELKAHLECYFSEEIVTELLSRDLYRDIDGKLYGVAATRGTNPLKGDEAYEVIRESDTKIIYRVKVANLDPNDPTVVTGYTYVDMNYESVGGKWVFTAFDMVR